jgi:RNA polymerase sigma factor (sigma-70 family)
MSEDKGKYDALVVSNMRLVYSMAKQRCSPYIRDDAAQEAAIKLWKVAKYHDPNKAKFSTYAGTCITRKLIDISKVESRRASHFCQLNTDHEELTDHITPLDVMVKKEEQEFLEKLHKAVQLLPLYERFVITFHYGLHGETPHSLRNVSEMAKIPYGTAKSIEQRAYKKLRTALNEECA